METLAAEGSPAGRGRRPAAALAVVIALCGAVIVQAGSVRRSTSITADEGYYLGAAIRSLQAGRLDPDLVKFGVAPLPIVVNYLPWLGLGGVPAEPRGDPWMPRAGDRGRIDGPRLATTLTSLVPLVVLAFAWLRRRRGLGAATLGAGLLAFSPTMLAHGSIATQDASFALHATLAVLAIGWFLRSPGWGRLVGSALAAGLAVSAKYSGIVLAPCVLAALGWLMVRERRPGLALARVSAFAAVAMATTWALHGFGVVGDWPAIEPGFVAAIRMQLNHSGYGHPGFLLGMRSVKGWPSYFPIAIGLKSSLPELAVFAGVAALLASWAVRAARGRGRGRPDAWQAAMAAFLVALMGALVQGRVNIGQRYAIALYPVAVLLAVDGWAGGGGLARRRALARLAGSLLLLGQVATAGAAMPRHLSYFNPIAGGAAGGWRLLADSNVDWGQDLPALRDLVDRRGYRRVAVDYFGNARLGDYGLEVDSPCALRGPIGDYDALAVSVNFLHSIYPRGPIKAPGHLAFDCYRDLRALPPAHRAGDSIFVYDLRDPTARRAAEGAVAALAAQLRGERPASVAEGAGRATR